MIIYIKLINDAVVGYSTTQFKRNPGVKINIDKRTYEQLQKNGVQYYKYINGALVNTAGESIKKEKLRKELQEIKQWFADTDYYCNKVLTGEWRTDDPRWTTYLSTRSIKRERYDTINNTLTKAI